MIYRLSKTESFMCGKLSCDVTVLDELLTTKLRTFVGNFFTMKVIRPMYTHISVLIENRAGVAKIKS